MRATGWVPRVLLALVVVGGLLLARGFSEPAQIAHASKFTVNSTGDGSDVSAGNGVCETSTSSECTLRAAIEEANALAGTDTINFNKGPGDIHPGTALPSINVATTIDGTTEPGYAGVPIVTLRGPVSAGVSGLVVNSTGVVIKGLVINRFDNVGVLIDTSGAATITNNYIGVDADGSTPRANVNGVRIMSTGSNTIGGLTAADRNVISGNSSDGIRIDAIAGGSNNIYGNYIGLAADGTTVAGNGSSGIRDESGGNAIGNTMAGARNVISGNSGSGVRIENADDTVVRGNYIGTDAAGTADRGNGLQGVYVSGSSDDAIIGGSTAAARNIISGNDSIGLYVEGTGAGHRVLGNYIGTNAAGTGGLGNTSGGVAFYADGVLGGTAAGEGNVISGNLNHGVQVGAPGVEIYGNYVGTNAAGTAALANTQYGINLLFLASSTTIGASGASGRNVVSGNTFYGIKISTDSNVLTNNYVGVGADGTTAIGNGSDGISVDSSDNTIGRVTAGDGNIVAYNSAQGVRIGTGDDNTIRGNYIYSNSGGGIDLFGATNDSIAAPVIDPALPPHGTACASCAIDLYSDAGTQGRYYEGTVTADGSGNWAFYGDVTSSKLTATATNASGSTSEFSAAKSVPPCSGICTSGIWKLDFIDTSPPIFNHYCTSSVTQSGATASWGELSCQDGLIEVYSATLTPNPDVTPNNNAVTANVIGPGGILSTSTGTYADDGNSASGTWSCTAVCTDSGTWTSTRLGAMVTVPAGVPTSLGSGVPPATITTPAGSPAITVEAVPLENITGGFLRTGFDFQPHGLAIDPLTPVRLDVFYDPVTDLPAGTDCRHIAHYRYDPLTGVSTFQSRVRCGTNNSFTVPITGFSVHRFEIGRDTDNDLVDDGTDVCPLVSDPAQTHSDAQILVLPGPDDWTVPYGDDSGDACDTDGDKDNDGLTDSQEAAGCGFGPTSPTNRDSDGDLFIDSAECALNKNPNLISDKPLISQCGPSGDLDGDGLLNQVEYCKYGTDPNNANSDRQHFNISDDTCDDGREAATVNANYAVDVLDLAAVAGQAGTYALPPTPTKLNSDFNRNASIDVLDLLAVATKATPSGFKCQLWPTLP